MLLARLLPFEDSGLEEKWKQEITQERLERGSEH